MNQAVNQALNIDAEIAKIRQAHRKREGLIVVPEPVQPKQPEWPAIHEAAYYGLAGDIVRTIEPHTEADPVALLLQILTLAGNVIGRSPYYQIESDYHRTNLFAVLVGDSAKSRKGTSLGPCPCYCESRGRNLELGEKQGRAIIG